jgi:hypothetical protein
LIPVLSSPLRVAITTTLLRPIPEYSWRYNLLTIKWWRNNLHHYLIKKHLPKSLKRPSTRANDASTLNNQYTIFTNKRDIG